MMSQTKPVVNWFADDPEPNTFFFRSPFRSWQFTLNTVLLAIVCLAYGLILWKYWGELNRQTSARWIFLFLLLFAVFPYLRAVKRHRSVRELYLSGALKEQESGSPVDTLLQVADNSINEGLYISLVMSGMLLAALVLWKFSHVDQIFHP